MLAQAPLSVPKLVFVILYFFFLKRAPPRGEGHLQAMRTEGRRGEIRHKSRSWKKGGVTRGKVRAGRREDTETGQVRGGAETSY